MGLAEAGLAGEDQRVEVTPAGGYFAGGAVRQPVALHDGEGLEGEPWVEVCWWCDDGGLRVATVSRGRRGRRLGAEHREGDGRRAAGELGDGAVDQRTHARAQPLEGEVCGDADDQAVAVESEAGRVAEPGFEVWPGHLELELAESGLPEILW